METTDQLRERIRAKLTKGWTYKRLSEKCGLSTATIHQFLRGSDPRGSNVDKLRKA